WTPISSTSSVAAMAKTPSLKASSRVVPISSMVAAMFGRPLNPPASASGFAAGAVVRVSSSPPEQLRRRPICVPSTRLASVDPALEGMDLLLRPGSVAGHRPCADLREDLVRVRGDVVVGPEVEGELHRLSVARPEQRFDVLVEADRLPRRRQDGFLA